MDRRDKLAKRQYECRMRQQWNKRKDAILRAVVIEGLRTADVCLRFKCTPGTLAKYRSEGLWKEKEAAMREDVYSQQKGRLASLVEPALDALGEVVRSPDEALRLKAATEILDRTGFPKGLVIDTEMKPVINLYMPLHLQAALKQEEEEFVDAEVIEGD